MSHKKNRIFFQLKKNNNHHFYTFLKLVLETIQKTKVEFD